MRIATYNVHKCRGWDGQRKPDRIAEVIAQTGAQVVAIQEADRRVGRRSGLMDPAALARRAGLDLVRVSEIDDGHGWHGNALLVAHAIRTAAPVRRLSLPGLEPRGAVCAVLDIPRLGLLRVMSAHLGLLPGCRTRQAAALVEFLARQEPLPTVLMGDLNEWRRESESLRILQAAFGMQEVVPSFPAPWPVLPLDRIMACNQATLVSVSAHRSLLARQASDHLPLVAEIAVRGAAAAGRRSDDADGAR